jgi:hypothetical protein
MHGMATLHRFSAKVWLYPGETASWHFVSVPKVLSAQLKKKYGGSARGWGSLPVEVRIGKTTWTTSIFPDSKSGTYLLPVKASVRRTEDLYDGDSTEVRIAVRT